ncbi:hypothetical protein D9M69_381190 [compost metagenome]
MRRRAVFQGVEQEAELLFLLLFADAEHAEHRLLHALVVDTDGTATQLGAVQHHVVGAGQGCGRVGLQLFRAALGRGEGVVQRGQAAVVVLFEHREVHDPHRRPLLGEQLEVMADLDAQRAQGFADDLGAVGAEEHDVAILGTHAIEDHVQVGLGDELDDRRLQALDALGALVDLDVGQALGAVDADELGVVVDLAARHARRTRNAQGGDAALRIVGRTGEHLEFHFLQLVGHVHQLQRNAQVRLVRTVAAHGFFEGHVREFVELDVQHFLEQLAHHLLGDFDDVAFFEEAGLDVDLGEFRLTVGTQVFVAEALGDLVVAVEAGHHQQLLEQLGRLRQGEEVARVGTARHQVVACAFRSRTAEDRGFHVEEAVLVQVAANAAGDARAQLQLGGHFRTAQVDEAVAQAGFLADVGVLVQRERRRLGLVQHFQLVAEHLDGAGGHVRVDRASRTLAHLAGDLDHVLAAHAIGLGEGLGTIRIEHHLGQAFAIADVEEDHPAVVAATVDPTAKSDFLAVQALVQLAAIMAAHHGGVLLYI